MPSEVLIKADTFDLTALDIATRYEIYLNNKEKGLKPAPKQLSQEEMLAMIKRVKERDSGKHNSKR